MLVCRHHSKDIVLGNNLTVLVGDLGIPTHLTVAASCAQGFLLSAQPDLQRVAIIHGLRKSQVVDAIVGEHGTEVRIDE
jgi:hypothetical protein